MDEDVREENIVGVLKFVRDKHGNVMGSKKAGRSTGITTIYDRHGNVLGRGDKKRDLTWDNSGRVVRLDGDPSFLLE